MTGRQGLSGHGRPDFGAFANKTPLGGGAHNPGNIGRSGLSGHSRKNTGAFVAKPAAGGGGGGGGSGAHQPGNIGRAALSGHGRPASTFISKPAAGSGGGGGSGGAHQPGTIGRAGLSGHARRDFGAFAPKTAFVQPVRNIAQFSRMGGMGFAAGIFGDFRAKILGRAKRVISAGASMRRRISAGHRPAKKDIEL